MLFLHLCLSVSLSVPLSLPPSLLQLLFQVQALSIHLPLPPLTYLKDATHKLTNIHVCTWPDSVLMNITV